MMAVDKIKGREINPNYKRKHPHNDTSLELTMEERWISVEDELPKKGTNVLFFSSGWNEPMMGYYKNWNWQRHQHIFHSYTDNATWYNVTHWMPLPAPPKKGGEKYV